MTRLKLAASRLLAVSHGNVVGGCAEPEAAQKARHGRISAALMSVAVLTGDVEPGTPLWDDFGKVLNLAHLAPVTDMEIEAIQTICQAIHHQLQALPTSIQEDIAQLTFQQLEESNMGSNDLGSLDSMTHQQSRHISEEQQVAIVAMTFSAVGDEDILNRVAGLLTNRERVAIMARLEYKLLLRTIMILMRMCLSCH